MGYQTGRAVGGSCLGGIAGVIAGVFIGGFLGSVEEQRHHTGTILDVLGFFTSIFYVGFGAIIGGVGGSVLGAALGSSIGLKGNELPPAPPSEQQHNSNDSIKAELARLRKKIADLERDRQAGPKPGDMESVGK